LVYARVFWIGVGMMKWPEELNFMVNSRKKQYKCNESMEGKRVVISGATSGVGLAATKELLKAGASIVWVIRNKQKAEDLRKDLADQYPQKIDIVIADFSDLDTVKEAANQLIKKYSKIDVLINSVGIHSTRRTRNKEGMEMCYVVNHLSVFLFTYLLIPTLKQNEHARIIQVNSEGHRFAGARKKDPNWKKGLYTGLRGYGASKSAQLLTTWEFAEQLKDSNVTINAMHPGAVRTKIGSNNGLLYRFWMKFVMWHFLKDVRISGEALYYLAASKELQNTSGRFFNLTIDEVPAKHARKKELGKEIYQLSMKLANLQK
jgi:NAD(P)-dependent dehydrogenase (short-subunit alcohol dehydrogenase family)